MRDSRLFGCWLLALAAASAPACSVPVFRYALERWPADPHVLTVGGALTAAQQAMLDRLVERSGNGLVNVDVVKEPAAAGAALRYPGSTLAWWTGAVDETALAIALDSPWRQEIAKRLVGGDSVVWVLVESGDVAKDQAAATLLDARLVHLASVLELPKQDPADLADLPPWKRSNYGPPLRLAFSSLRLSRTNPMETGLVALLLGSDPALAKVSDPIAFAVFGRGRFLEGVHGKDLSNQTIDGMSLFLTGACSCQVKEMNPGTDLLLTFDWEEALIKATPKPKEEKDAATATPASGAATASAPPAAVAGIVAAPVVETLVSEPLATAPAVAGTAQPKNAQSKNAQRDDAQPQAVAIPIARDLRLAALIGLGVLVIGGLTVFVVRQRKP